MLLDQAFTADTQSTDYTRDTVSIQDSSAAGGAVTMPAPRPATLPDSSSSSDSAGAPAASTFPTTPVLIGLALVVVLAAFASYVRPGRR